MSVAVEAHSPSVQVADEIIVRAILGATADCLNMCDATARCVGVAAVPCHDFGSVTGMIGLHGDVSGFVTVNMSETVACSTVGGLLQDRFERLSPQVIDGVGEMTNIISGGIKRTLVGTRWAFKHVTVPSVIVGQRYQIAYAKGIEYACATFEHDNADALLLPDRLLHVAVSLIKL